jgi:Predicted nucleoside-diphosphate-sugar epimerases
MSKKAILLGASGLVGGQLLRQLLESGHYDQVVSLARRALPLEHPKLVQKQLDFDHPDQSLVVGDDLFCALGTTLRKAGSKEAQYRIDCLYPIEVGNIARQNGVRRFLLVSSVGANPDTSNFYLRTKGELEEKIKKLDFECFVSARPSFLLGDRTEFRLGEKIGILLAKLFAPLIPRRYRGVQAAVVAKALIHAANDGRSGSWVLENEALDVGATG